MNTLHKCSTPKQPKFISKKSRKAIHKHTKGEIQIQINREKYITNLSSKTLDPPQTEVLSLGLTFVPSRHLLQSQLIESLEDFERGNRIKHFFKDRPSTEPHPFKEKSTWMPPKASKDIEKYLNRVRTEINTIKPLKMTPNLTPTQKKALKELQSDPTLIIKSADKGSGIVVEDTEQYIKDGFDHLSDTKIYREIATDPTQPLTEAINDYVNIMYEEGIMDPITKKFLTLETNPPPRTQQLYFLKKIRNNPIAVRPIVSGCGGPTEKISQLVDLHLKPHIPKIRSYLKDSGHLISILEGTPVPINHTLATIDVKSLYLNIPHEEGITAVLNRLYDTPELTDKMTIPPGNMKDLLGIVLKQNYFQFADRMYHQIQGTAMGTKMAPSYANIFMTQLEEKLLANYAIKPSLWYRFIDDIFCIWPGPQSELKQFLKYLNEAHPTINFTYESSTKSVDFMDLTIYKGPRHNSSLILDIKPFFKPTNKFQYLEFSSAHPRNTFASLTKGELTRLLRACSNEETYKQVSSKLTKALEERGYPKQMLQRTLQQVPFQNRTQLLQGKEEKEIQTTYDTFFKTTKQKRRRYGTKSMPKPQKNR